jgi:hypothetical protein
MIDNKRKQKIFSIKKVRNQKKWSKEEDEKLINIVQENNEKNWKKISSYFKKKNPLQCFSRYKRIRPGIKKGFWKKEEDELILSLIKEYGTSWSTISKIIKTRTGKQIRDRYINVLASNINKNKFSVEEDNLLLNLYKKFGPKWSKIHNYFKDRTTDMIKNRFHSTLKRKKLDENNNIINNNYINKNVNNIEKNRNNKNEFVYSNETSLSNNKETSTISKLSYPPFSFSKNFLEKEERKNIDNQINTIFNNDFFGYTFDDDYYYM